MEEEKILVESNDKQEIINVDEEVVDSTLEESVDIVEITDIQIVEVGVDSAFASLGNPNDMSVHGNLHGITDPDQHPIAAITGLRAELNSLNTAKTPQTLYSDKIGVANYYTWNDGAYDEVGYFVSLVPDTSNIKLCDGSDIFGVTVDAAGFIGGQDATVPRDNTYALVATNGLVDVRCESDVADGDYVISNEHGWAAKTTSNCGYKVVSVNNKQGVLYASVVLGVQACTTDAIGKNLQYLESRVGVNETNIISAINVANQAYNKVNEIGVSNQIMSDKVDGALDTVDKVVSDVEDLGSQVSNSSLISAQAKAIAESAATSAESMKQEAVEKANEALADTSELRKEFEDKVAEIDTELDNAALELQATHESIESTRDELQSNITSVSTELDNTKVDLSNTRNELSSEIDDVLSSLGNTNSTIASITKRVDKNESSINNLTTWKDTANVTITNIEQKTDENAGSISILTAWKSDVEDDVESIASIKTQSDANKSSIENLTSWQGTASESLASVKQQSDANKASIDSITSWQGETDESFAQVKQQTDSNAASIKSLTEWKGTASESISSIEQRVDDAESNISSLTSWQGEAKTSIANVEQKSNANESKINSLTSWQNEATTAISNVEQKATANESAITSLTSWQDEATKSIAAVKQTADKNSADISVIASWKSDVEDDVSSIASIKTTADENKAAIEQLVKKDTELSTTIAGVKTTADANKASIEQITSWQSKVDPTINSVAGIKQTADSNAAKIEGLTSWQGETNIAMARIEQKADANGAYIQSTVSNMDKYSVGPYSQAYGFTLEQAGSVLEEGMIYVPTTSHQEEYQYTDSNKNTQTYKRSFTPQYLYQWGKVSGQYRWITVDKNYTATSETNTSSKAVYFTTTEPAVSGNFGYWYTNGGTITDTTGTYESYTLYKWESYVDENKATQHNWVAVATLAGNSQSRAVSQIRQDANSIELDVTNVKGDLADIKIWAGDDFSAIQDTVTWKNNNSDAIAQTIQKASDSEAYIAQIASVKNDDGTVNATASIVTAVNNSDSSVVIDADHVNLHGYVTMTNLSTGGQTMIDGSNIITGTIDADKIDVDDLQAFNANIGGWSIDYDGIEKSYCAGILSSDNNQVVSSVDPTTTSSLRFYAGSGQLLEKLSTQWFETITPPFNSETISRTIGDANFKILNITVEQVVIGPLAYEVCTNKEEWESHGVFINQLQITGQNTFSFEVDITGELDGNAGEFYIDFVCDGIDISTLDKTKSKFMVLEDGSLYAKNADIDGKINAKTGNIGGWEINDGGIENHFYRVGLISTDNRKTQSLVNAEDKSSIRFYAGQSGSKSEEIATWTGTIPSSYSEDATLTLTRATPFLIENVEIQSVSIDGQLCSNQDDWEDFGIVISQLKVFDYNAISFKVSTNNLAENTYNVEINFLCSVIYGAGPKGTDYRFMVLEDGSLYANACKISGTIIGSEIIGGSLIIGDTKKNDNYAEIDESGILTTKGARIQGHVEAATGSISGWEFDENGLFVDSSETGVGLWCTTLHDNIAIHAGATTSNINSAPFKVYHDGSMSATKADITGNVNMAGGSVSIGKPESNSGADDNYACFSVDNSGRVRLNLNQYEDSSGNKGFMVYTNKRINNETNSGWHYAQTIVDPTNDDERCIDLVYKAYAIGDTVYTEKMRLYFIQGIFCGYKILD